jgi:hypothetical protein
MALCLYDYTENLKLLRSFHLALIFLVMVVTLVGLLTLSQLLLSVEPSHSAHNSVLIS